MLPHATRRTESLLRRLPLLAPFAILAVVLPTGRPVRGQTVRDSAGVHIVQNPAVEAAPTLWTVPAKPVSAIGSADAGENYQLYKVNGGAFLPDGGVAISNSGTEEIRIYDAAGRYVRTLGREGGGPGEFRSLGWLAAARGDTLLAYDQFVREVSIFDAKTGFVRSYQLMPEGGKHPAPLGMLANGALAGTLSKVYRGGRDKTGVRRDTIEFALFDEQGGPTSLGMFPGHEAFVQAEGRMITVGGLPFGRGTFGAVVGKHVAVGNNDAYRIDLLDASGKVDLSIRADYTPVPVTGADKDAEREQRKNRMAAVGIAGVGSGKKRAEDALAGMPVPATMPAYQSLMSDGAGDLWVEASRHSADSTPVWAVFGPDGKLRGQVRTPPGATVLAVRGDRLLGLWKDDLDVEHVGLWKMQRGGGR